MISLHDPLYLLMALGLILVWILQKWWGRKPAAIQFSSVNLLKGVPSGLKIYLHKFGLLLKILGLLLMVYALARPQQSDTKVKRNVEGIDIVIAFDISDSMLIEDMQPENRLEAAKVMTREFVEKRISDRIGLVLFSGEAFTRVPPTLDYKVLIQAIKDIDINRNVKMGTAIGVALANSVARLRDSTAKSRVIILMTDGENNSGTIDPETALDIAKGYGLKVYTIGVGRDGMAQLPIWTEDSFGNRRKRYQPMMAKVNDELLGKIASETGGKYYRASESEALRGVFNDINNLEKSKIDVNKFTKYTELFQDYLRWGIILIGCSLLLTGVLVRRGP